MQVLASGENVLAVGVVGGRVQRFESTTDVLDFFEAEPSHVVALTPHAGSTFLSPIVEDLAAIVTMKGSRTGHLAILSREFHVPCVLRVQLEGELEGREVLVDTRDVSVARLYACPTWLLVALHVQGIATRESLEEAVGERSSADVSEALSLVQAAGYVEARGDPTRYALVDAGRSALARALEEERVAAGPELLDGAYGRFEELDPEVKAVATDWQVRDAGPPLQLNDHSDERYDARVRGRLARVHRGIGPILEELGRAIPRYRSYKSRLEAALSAVNGGEVEALASPRGDSYHTVWFQLHEDLLITTGRTRKE